MASEAPTPALPSTIAETLSADRFARYVAWAEGDQARALELYRLNVRVSAELTVPLHFLEVALRNRVNAVMTRRHGPYWFDDPAFVLKDEQRAQLADGRANLARERKDETPDRLIAETTFSFWTSMLNNEYEPLWRTGLSDIALSEEGRRLTRKKLSAPLGRLRTLRNRIAHHEPIIYWSLPKHHDMAIQLTRWLAPPAADLAEQESRFHEVWPDEGLFLPRTV